MPRKITFSVVSIRETTGAIDGTCGAVARGVVAAGGGAVAGSGRNVVAVAAAPSTSASCRSPPTSATTPTVTTATSTITAAANAPARGDIDEVARPCSMAQKATTPSSRRPVNDVASSCAHSYTMHYDEYGVR